MRFFADRHRIWALPLVGVLLVADAVVWTRHSVNVPGPDVACSADPKSCAGQFGVLPLRTVYSVDGPDSFLVGRPGSHVQARGSSAGLLVGQEITVGGTYADGELNVAWIEKHPYRPWKRRLGVLGIVVLGGILVGGFAVRRTQNGWRVVRRHG